MRFVFAAPVASVFLFSCSQTGLDTSSSQQNVVGAEITTGDPAVVALATSRAIFCTGTLVSPRVVLTAAHCIDDGGPNFAAVFGPDGNSGTRISAMRTQSHPMWNGMLNGGNDIGMILLAAAPANVQPIPLNRTALTTISAQDYRVVGFGIHDKVTRELDGKKRTTVMKMINFNGTYVELDDKDPANPPATSICQGDSGGPGFVTVDGQERIAGVHSYSIQGCENPSGDTRVDLFVEQFVQPWLDANDPSCGSDGKCFRVGCSNDPDCQPCGGDGTCAMNCPVPDIDCPTQEVGEICRADSQCLSGKCIFWSEDPRVKYCSQSCDAGCPSDMECTTQNPFGQVCTHKGVVPGSLGTKCETAADCAEYECVDGTCAYTCSIPRGSFCPTDFTCEDRGKGARCWGLEKADEGGCSTSTPSPTAMLILLALFGGWTWKRRGHRI